MKRMPTTAKLAASSRRFATTKRSARGPVIAGRHPSARRRRLATLTWEASRQPLRIRRVIDREQVLHVARLARLELGGDEVERMAAELGSILQNVERVRQPDPARLEPAPPGRPPPN